MGMARLSLRRHGDHRYPSPSSSPGAKSLVQASVGCAVHQKASLLWTPGLGKAASGLRGSQLARGASCRAVEWAGTRWCSPAAPAVFRDHRPLRSPAHIIGLFPKGVPSSRGCTAAEVSPVLSLWVQACGSRRRWEAVSRGTRARSQVCSQTRDAMVTFLCASDSAQASHEGQEMTARTPLLLQGFLRVLS